MARKAKMVTKTKRFACSCPDCRSACENKPGWFLPSEIAPLAKQMGLSVAELFQKHLAVDWWCADSEIDHEVFVLSPAVRTETPGDMFSGDPHGTCVFYRRGKCAIHALGKPHECAALTHSGAAAHVNTARAWNKPKHQAMIRRLLGREPEAEEMPASASLLGRLLGW
jgi:hypothetical protein